MATESSHLYSSGPPRVLSNLLRFVVELASIELFPLYPTHGKAWSVAFGAFAPPPLAHPPGEVNPRFRDLGVVRLNKAGEQPGGWSAPLTEVFCHAD